MLCLVIFIQDKHTFLQTSSGIMMTSLPAPIEYSLRVHQTQNEVLVVMEEVLKGTLYHVVELCVLLFNE
jgi:hypothetical protein